MKFHLQAMVGFVLLVFTATSVLAGQSRGTTTVTWTPTVQGDKYKKPREFTIMYDLKVKITVTDDEGNTSEEIREVHVQLPFGEGTTAAGITKAFELAFPDALDSEAPGHGVTFSSAKDGSTFFAKGNSIQGKSAKSSTSDVTIFCHMYKPLIRSRSHQRGGGDGGGKRKRSHYGITIFPDSIDYTHYLSGRFNILCTGSKGPKGGPPFQRDIATRISSLSLYGDMEEGTVALALAEKLTDAGWEAVVNPANPIQVLIGSMPEDYNIDSITVWFSYEGAEHPSGIEDLPGHGLELEVVYSEDEEEKEKGKGK